MHGITREDSMFSVRQTPWHRLGTVLADYPTPEEAWDKSGFDFVVEKVPTWQEISFDQFMRSQEGAPDAIAREDTRIVYPQNEDETGRVVYQAKNKSAYITRRTDTGRELGVVGKDYTPLQNRDAFKVMVPLVEEGLAKFETAGTLQGGRRVWLMTSFNLEKLAPVTQEVFLNDPRRQNDLVLPYGFLSNAHDGSRSVTLQESAVRIVCLNTLGLAEERGDGGRERSIKVRHGKDVEANVVAAAMNLWHDIIKRYERMARQYKLLKATYLDEFMFRELVEKVAAPDPRANPKFNPEARMADAVVQRYERKATRLREAWMQGDGHVGDFSAWEAYNGAVQVLDHDSELYPNKSGVYRTQSLLIGKLGQMKDQILNNLVEYGKTV